MLIQWLTFACMVLIQAVAAVWAISAIRTTLEQHSVEIQTLRDFKHEMTSKGMAVDQHEREIVDHETRLRVVEKLAHEHDRRIAE